MALAVKEAEDLIGDLNLSGEERELMEKILTDEKRQNVIKSRMHGKGEADRLMAEAKAQQQKYEALETDANTKIEGWLKWKADEDARIGRIETESQAAKRRELELRNYLVSQNIDPDMAVPALANNGGNGTQSNTTPNAAFDWSKVMDDPKFKETFLPREEANQTVNGMLMLADMQHKINQRHRKLFGTDIEDFSVLRAELQAENARLPENQRRSLEQYADAKLGFSTKEAENAEKAIQDRIEKEVSEKLAARISAQGIPGANAAITPDDTPIFKDEFANRAPASEAEQDRKAVERAMQFELGNPNHAAGGGIGF